MENNNNGNGNVGGNRLISIISTVLAVVIAIGAYSAYFASNYLTTREHAIFLDSTNRDIHRLEESQKIQDERIKDEIKRLDAKIERLVAEIKREDEKKLSSEEFRLWKEERSKVVDTMNLRIDKLYQLYTTLQEQHFNIKQAPHEK